MRLWVGGRCYSDLTAPRVEMTYAISPCAMTGFGPCSKVSRRAQDVALCARAGTLTQNRMEAVRLWAGCRCYSNLTALTAPSVETTYTVGPRAMTGFGPCSKGVAPGARCRTVRPRRHADAEPDGGGAAVGGRPLLL